MACATYTLKGIARGCRDSIGGIYKVWINTAIDSVRAEIAATTQDTPGKLKITDVSKFIPFEMFAKTGSMESTLNYAETAGNSFTTNVNLVFIKQEAAKRLEVMGLCMQEFCMAVEDKNGVVHFLGATGNGYVSAATAGTGTGPQDANSYNLTLTFDEVDLPAILTDDTVSKLHELELA